MFIPFRKFVAVFLAIWLPLFSGSALAASVAMQASSGDCNPAAVAASQHNAHHVSTTHLHATHYHEQVTASQEQEAGQQTPQSSTCKDCGVCHFACSGFLAAISTRVTATLHSAQAYATSLTQFQSFTPAPLDPPPLSRV